jgi:pyruvate/2-oxoglutarate dehydrogenase complex dihydrolipoamide acyltransferase (E2) component
LELRGRRIVVRGTAEEHAAITSKEKPKPKPADPAGATQVYTLKVNGEPLNKVLPALARQLKLELAVDEEAIKASGIAYDRRVTFEVKEASLKELLEAVFKDTKLTWHVENGKLTVVP